MDSDRFKIVEKIYHSILQISPSERDSFLQDCCGNDLELRQEVESLLSFENDFDSRIDTPPETLAAEVFTEPKTSDLTGKQINQYKIISLLGKGGMGAVYLAEDTKLDRQVAVKFLNDRFVHETDKVNRFIREAKAASALNHPNILTVYEIGENDGSHYIATEFIDGKVLNQHKSKERFTLESILDISIQTVSALQTAHDAGIIHRDIKPDNVMLRKDGIVKVLDFGLAKLTEKQSDDLDSEAATIAKITTNPGMIMGTPDYMSPEQARGKGITLQTDIFSFGIVLYEMLSGKLPFRGESAMDTIGAILHKEAVPIIQLLPQLPRDVEYIVNKTLRKNTSERYQNTKDLLTDLRRVKQRLNYEEVGRSFSPEDLNADSDAQETKIFDSADFAQIISPENEPPNNLTESSSPIIGREKEIAEITDLLKQDSVRLLTMTGIGGTGKTRLAQTVARRMLGEFSDGVFFVILAPITDYKLVVPTIAQTLGVKESGDKSILEVLNNHLSDKQLLLVIDNFEQVIEAAPDIGELLKSSGELKILITSRELLNLSAEREIAVSPLAVPSAEKRISVNKLVNNEAVRFFVERAKFAKSDFVLMDENASSVAEICRRLDGLPLAIELAAARVKLFAPQAILKRLEKSLDLLTGGAKDLPERRQTMRGAIAWSYDLLDADEKKLFNRLAVFVGGFTLDGAEFVGKKEDEKLDSVLDLISSLLDKSLIIRGDQADGEPRFRMLVVVREFAFETLMESGEADEIKQRHAGFYLQLSEIAKQELMTEKAAQWLDTLEKEHDNLRVVLEWSLENQPETALRIVSAIHWFWIQRGYLPEGRKWTQQAIDKSGEDSDPKLRSAAYADLSIFSSYQGDLEEAEPFAEESLRLARKADDKTMISAALAELGIYKINSDLTQAKVLLEESLAIARELDEGRLISSRLNSLGEIARHREDYEVARKHYQEALTIAGKESIKILIPLFTTNLAAVEYQLGNYQSARLHALGSFKVSEEFDDKISIGLALCIFAVLAVAGEDAEKAARLFGAAQTIHDAVGFKIEKADQKFIDPSLIEARTAIGDEAFDAAYAEGHKLSIEEAIAFAREGESEKETHITSEANTDTQSYVKTDTIEAQTLIIPPNETTIPDVSRLNNFLSRFPQRVFAAALIIVFLIAGAFVGYRYLTANNQIRSIAVMPFVNQTGNADNEYLSDGLTDSLINKLSELPQMKVISRSSTFKYKGNLIDISKIAKTLGVQAVVTGRITQQGDILQISVEMTDAADNTQIWGEIYRRKVSDVLDVQQEITQAVAKKLNVQLSGSEKQKIAKQATYNSQAYQYYLNGVFYRRRNGANNLKKGIEYQNQAIELDPDFAPAYAETALNYGVLVEIGAIDPAAGKPKARTAAEKAVALDNTLPEAYFAMGYIENQDLNWTAAEQNFKRAIELNPNFAGAHTLYATYLSQLGRTDEALSEIKKAQELDPLRVGLIGNEGIILYYARRYNEAILKMQEGLKPEPENAPARVYLGQAYIADKQFNQAISELKIADKADSESTNALIYLGQAHALSGNRLEALNILNQLKTTKKYVSPAALAIFYAALGDKEAAFKSIEKAYDERDINLQFLKVEPGYDSLRDDPRFQQWLQKIGFPQ